MTWSAAKTAAHTLVPRPAGLIASPHKSDVFVPFRDPSLINICGVFHAYDPVNDNPTKHLWLEDVRLGPPLAPNIAMPAIPSSNTQNFQHPIIGSLPIRQWILKLVSRLLILI